MVRISNAHRRGRLFPAALALVGLALLSYGSFIHFSLAGRARCDGCAPWHPLFVVAPLAVGAVLLGIGLVWYARG